MCDFLRSRGFTESTGFAVGSRRFAALGICICFGEGGVSSLSPDSGLPISALAVPHASIDTNEVAKKNLVMPMYAPLVLSKRRCHLV